MSRLSPERALADMRTAGVQGGTAEEGWAVPSVKRESFGLTLLAPVTPRLFVCDDSY
jgi:hypothetical protein